MLTFIKSLIDPSNGSADMLYFGAFLYLIAFAPTPLAFTALIIVHGFWPQVGVDATSFAGGIAGLAGACATVLGAVTASYRFRGNGNGNGNGAH